MPEDFTVKKSKNSEPQVNEKPTKTKKPTKKKTIMCFGIVFLTLLALPAVSVPILFVKKKNVGNNISVNVNNVTVNNVTLNKIQNKGLAKKKIIKDGKEFFVMTKKQVKLTARIFIHDFQISSKSKI